MKRSLLIAILVLLAGCTKELDFEQMEKSSPEEIFAIGQAEQTAGRYSDAVKVFEELEKVHPYSHLVPDAQLKAAECYYQNGKLVEAATAYETFVRTHPTHEKVPFALYQLGMLNYEQMPIVERDQDPTLQALAFFEELMERYPNSSYAKNLKSKILDLKNQLAGHEVYVARYYSNRKNYTAAVGRLNVVIESYPETDQAPEAMFRLCECYTALGFDAESKKMRQVLIAKYPNSSWTQHAKELMNTTEKHS